jgi:hypothetical protein
VKHKDRPLVSAAKETFEQHREAERKFENELQIHDIPPQLEFMHNTYGRDEKFTCGTCVHCIPLQNVPGAKMCGLSQRRPWFPHWVACGQYVKK